MPSKREIKLPTKNRLFVERNGSGEPILLLHGLLHSHSYWHEVVKYIPSTRYEAIAPDLLGFGRSDKPKGLDYTIDDHIEALEVAILDNTHSPITLVGHSMGAMIALRLAAKYPDRVKSLVLINLPLFADSKQAGRIVRRALRPLQRAYVSRAGVVLYWGAHNHALKIFVTQSIQGTGTELPNEVIAGYYQHTWQSFKKSLTNVVFNYPAHGDLQNIRTKTKFIYSKDDPFFTPAALETIDGLSHFECIELGGKHRIPIEQARRVAFEICS